MKRLITIALLLSTLAACTLEQVDNSGSSGSGTNSNGSGEIGRVVNVIDGDTIDVEIDGFTHRVRYVGVNTPERDEVCYGEASQANRDLVDGKTVRLERDTSDTDRYDRLLRYVYVDDVFVNAELIRQGYAEVVLYEPDEREFESFRSLEQAATRANLNCHNTGIFDDGTYAR